MSSQKVDIAIQPAVSQQPHKLPIPRLQQQTTAGSLVSTSKPNEMLIPSAWPTAAQLPLTTLPVIPCQQTLTANPPGKPVPNKRGRKPLTTMPSTKKHIQNLTNQRAFRQRREQYIRGLEQKASMFEVLYLQVVEENKALKEQLAALSKQRGDGNVCGTGLSADQLTAEYANKIGGDKVADAVDGTMFFNHHQQQQQQQQSKGGANGDVMMNDAVSQASVGSDGSNSISSSQLYQFPVSPPSPSGQFSPVSNDAYQALSAFSSPTHAEFTFDDSQQKQQLQTDSLNQTSLQPAGEFLDSMFCETKNGELCYCDPAVPNNKRVWIIPKDLVSAPYATPDPGEGYFTTTPNGPPALPSPDEPEPQWQMEHQAYYAQQPITPPSSTTTFPNGISNASSCSNGAQELKWVNGNGANAAQDNHSPRSA